MVWAFSGSFPKIGGLSALFNPGCQSDLQPQPPLLPHQGRGVVVLTMSYVVDTVQELSPLLVVQVLPLASDNLNRVLGKKESAGRAVGTGKEWIAWSKDRSGNGTHHSRLLERTKASSSFLGGTGRGRKLPRQNWLSFGSPLTFACTYISSSNPGERGSGMASRRKAPC